MEGGKVGTPSSVPHVFLQLSFPFFFVAGPPSRSPNLASMWQVCQTASARALDPAVPCSHSPARVVPLDLSCAPRPCRSPRGSPRSAPSTPPLRGDSTCAQTLAEKAKAGGHPAAKAAVAAAPSKSAHASKDAKNYGADILQMMAHAKKLEGHSITRSDAHGSLNPLGVGSIVIPYHPHPALPDWPLHVCACLPAEYGRRVHSGGRCWGNAVDSSV